MQDTRYIFQYKGQRLPTGVHISGTGAAFIKERFQRGTLYYYSPMFQPQGATDSLFLHIGADQVGSIRTLSLEDGRMVKEVSYDSFGNRLHDSFPELSFPLGFAGGLVDEHIDFVRFGYRDYDPQTGRFTAQDPARDLRGDADLYDYCVDDPVSCNDPQGLATLPWLARFMGKRIGSELADLAFPDTVSEDHAITNILENSRILEEKIKAGNATKEDREKLEELNDQADELWKKYGDRYQDPNSMWKRYFPDAGYPERMNKRNKK